jgi:hypothetical protein
MRVQVLFWFDVEDYVTAESDVALGRLIDIFDRHQAKATFKMVGEKVRGLQRRGHSHILRKLDAHDIGYHTDYHSRSPTIPEYLLGCDWEGGIAEFERRERAGLATLREAFHRTPSCYGQPGGAWAPHVYPALRQWGIPVYLDAGPWVALDGKPHRYCGVLNLLGLEHTMSLGISGGEAAVAQRLAEAQERLSRLQHTGGAVSLYAHECEFVTSAFWDGVNFAEGSDPPREQWRPAPLLAAEESEDRYRAMDRFLGAVASLPQVDLVVASEANLLYADRAKGRSFTPQQIARLCESMADQVSHQQIDGAWLSPAEILSLAVRLLAARAGSGQWPEQLPFRYVEGPSEPPHIEIHDRALTLEDLFGTCLYERAAMDLHRRVPSEVQIGRTWLPPAVLLATIGSALPKWVRGDEVDAPIVRGRLASTDYVADHVSWGWTVFPPGFDGDQLLRAANLQAWTLKPAPLA